VNIEQYHSVELDPEKTDADLAAAWAKDHCASYVTHSTVIITTHRNRYSYSSDILVRFYFEFESDRILFALKWS
jgi:hypothetical protein